MDRRKIEMMQRALHFFDATIAAWESLRREEPEGARGDGTDGSVDSKGLIRKLAEERLLERAFLSVSDAAILTIEWLVHRDVGSYEEMADILELEEAIGREEGKAMRVLVRGYRALTRDYLKTYEHMGDGSFTSVREKTPESAEVLESLFSELSLPALARLSSLLRQFWLKEGIALEG